jgi:hypothetical protein
MTNFSISAKWYPLWAGVAMIIVMITMLLSNSKFFNTVPFRIWRQSNLQHTERNQRHNFPFDIKLFQKGPGMPSGQNHSKRSITVTSPIDQDIRDPKLSSKLKPDSTINQVEIDLIQSTSWKPRVADYQPVSGLVSMKSGDPKQSSKILPTSHSPKANSLQRSSGSRSEWDRLSYGRHSNDVGNSQNRWLKLGIYIY